VIVLISRIIMKIKIKL